MSENQWRNSNSFLHCEGAWNEDGKRNLSQYYGAFMIVKIIMIIRFGHIKINILLAVLANFVLHKNVSLANDYTMLQRVSCL